MARGAGINGVLEPSSFNRSCRPLLPTTLRRDDAVDQDRVEPANDRMPGFRIRSLGMSDVRMGLHRFPQGFTNHHGRIGCDAHPRIPVLEQSGAPSHLLVKQMCITMPDRSSRRMELAIA